MVTDLRVQYPDHWELQDTYGALPWLHPTHAHFYDPILKATLEWWSTRHRKAKPVKVNPDYGKVIRREIRLWGGNRWTDYTNPSWWEAQGFLLGSICWCVNGSFAMWQLTNENAQSYVIGYTGLVGATLFQLGGISGFFEAVNRPNEGPIRFGYDVEKLDSKDPTEFLQALEGKKYPWRWFGFKYRDNGFWANSILFLGTTIFWIGPIVGVPHVLPDEETHYLEWDFLYWLPQPIGSTCFILQGLLCMLEVQRTWYGIKPFDLGWHVGLWNLVGGVGFWLSGFFGFYADPADKWQHWGTAFSTFWGSWAFLIGSVLQLYETLN